MHTKEAEEVLTKISSKEPLCIDEKDFEIIEEMVDEGLIKPNNEGYSLTDYGKVIEVMGFETHQKQEQNEPPEPKPVINRSIIIFLAWLLAVCSILGCVYSLSL
ncbi:hypothetical protein [Salegentibacter sediminis]|uniref:hypothetical protein n=1 Tax=Salegentibacter sediminis TaxID=1930251 RepID=UPI0009BF8563|nr:hypothetical protein [Salegentibacter sediminis]